MTALANQQLSLSRFPFQRNSKNGHLPALAVQPAQHNQIAGDQQRGLGQHAEEGADAAATVPAGDAAIAASMLLATDEGAMAADAASAYAEETLATAAPWWPTDVPYVRFSMMSKSQLESLFSAILAAHQHGQLSRAALESALEKAVARGNLPFDGATLEELKCLTLGGPASEPGGPECAAHLMQLLAMQVGHLQDWQDNRLD